jgi:hypothetical protein
VTYVNTTTNTEQLQLTARMSSTRLFHLESELKDLHGFEAHVHDDGYFHANLRIDADVGRTNSRIYIRSVDHADFAVPEREIDRMVRKVLDMNVGRDKAYEHKIDAKNAPEDEVHILGIVLYVPYILLETPANMARTRACPDRIGDVLLRVACGKDHFVGILREIALQRKCHPQPHEHGRATKQPSLTSCPSLVSCCASNTRVRTSPFTFGIKSFNGFKNNRDVR